VTSLGLPAKRATTRAVPLRPKEAESALPVELTPRQAVPAGWVRVGTIRVHRAGSYLLAWAAVLFAVLFLVLVGGYLLLWGFGVTASVSEALAIVLGEPLPESGVLPMLQPQAVLPMAVLVSFLLSFLSLAATFAAVLVHNAVSSLTGGLLVRIRPADRAPRVPAPRV